MLDNSHGTIYNESSYLYEFDIDRYQTARLKLAVSHLVTVECIDYKMSFNPICEWLFLCCAVAVMYVLCPKNSDKLDVICL